MSLRRCRWRVTTVPFAPVCDILLCFCWHSVSLSSSLIYRHVVSEEKQPISKQQRNMKMISICKKKKKKKVLCYLTKLLDNNSLILKVWQSLNNGFHASFAKINHRKGAEALSSLLLCYDMLSTLTHRGHVRTSL